MIKTGNLTVNLSFKGLLHSQFVRKEEAIAMMSNVTRDANSIPKTTGTRSAPATGTLTAQVSHPRIQRS